ncbi:Protein CDC73 [Galdieria sulphuraria]|uniref:PAF1 complex protein n=1 Tax=Galdieria sulphuraria TaxID=130081 RepID=M2XZL6_GALSU|nr:PAF1 complex protein [Galdieria sulphuraria]EME29019.1 PAF1 complex protein [Galdieria sulphuraria]GJD06957.1 Protein CDC73 [Galdieria sulphuraria]|eukprot:XP_005705539.1 PAF1 complex protein [Galdieria sulphuraria]
MEPLLLLREANKRSESVVLEGDNIVFKGSNKSFPRNFPTAYFPSRGREKQPYTLEVVWFLFQHADKSFREYVSECVRAGVSRVQIIDSRDLIAFFRGELDTCAGIKVSSDAEESLSEKRSFSAPEGQRKKDLDGAIREALNQEHEQQTISSLLASKERHFKNLVERIKRLRKESEEQMAPAQTESIASKKQQMDPRGDRYSIREDMFYRENIGAEVDELGIDPSGRFGLSSTNSGTNLNGTGVIKSKETSVSNIQSASLKENVSKKPKTNVTPIIVVPSGYNSLINILNAPEFLEKGHFVPWQSLKAQGMTNVSWSVKIKHVSNASQTPVEYQIINNTSRLSSEDWKRVCAVVCNGAQWQFKGWPYPGTAELFADVRGFYFYFDDEQVDPNVRGWVVKCLPISRNKRHLDYSVALEFWRTLEAHVKARKPHLKV